MIKKWFNTTAIELANMLDVTDAVIVENSNGLVIKAEDLDAEPTKEALKGTPIDADIFGELGKECPTKMGHIELPVTIVNIQYTHGSRAMELPTILGMSLHDIEILMYYCGYLIPAELNAGEVIIHKATEETEGEKLLGADAIEALLKRKGINSDKYILRTLPVMPTCMRYMKVNDCPNNFTAYHPNGLNFLYEMLLDRINSYNRVCEVGESSESRLPWMISYELLRRIQHGADDLINNGFGSFPYGIRGVPLDSLHELYVIASTYKKPKRLDLEAASQVKLDDGKIAEIIDKVNNLGTDDENMPIDGVKVLNKEEEKEFNALKEEMFNIFTPLIDFMFDNYFENYKDARNDAMPHIENAIDCSVSGWDAEKEGASRHFSTAIFKSIGLYFDKKYALKGESMYSE